MTAAAILLLMGGKGSGRKPTPEDEALRAQLRAAGLGEPHPKLVKQTAKLAARTARKLAARRRQIAQSKKKGSE